MSWSYPAFALQTASKPLTFMTSIQTWLCQLYEYQNSIWMSNCCCSSYFGSQYFPQNCSNEHFLCSSMLGNIKIAEGTTEVLLAGDATVYVFTA